ncbi:MAG: hypothetical protein WBC93_04380 [Sulfitobacter sp.]
MNRSNFLKENNARRLWHPTTHPADSLINPPHTIVEADGVEITETDIHRMVDAVGGLWNVNLGHSCAPVKAAFAAQLDRLATLACAARHAVCRNGHNQRVFSVRGSHGA